MKIVVRVELTTDWGEVTEHEISRIERPGHLLRPENVGLSLQDGKHVLQRLQQPVFASQTHEFCALHRVCSRCHRITPIKDYQQRKVDTVFGGVTLRCPRIISCPCEPPYFLEAEFSPIQQILPERATTELQLLQASICAQMPYRQAANMMRQFLPVGEKFNHVTLRNRTLRIGARIDKVEVPVTPTTKTPMPWTLTIDGGFVRGVGKGELRNFGLLTGRLAAPGLKPYVFAWVGSEASRAADRVTNLVRARAGEQPKLCVITDGANNIRSIHRALPFPAKPILDWFHISMRIRHLEQIVSGLWAKTETEQATKKLLTQHVTKLRWCFWHANPTKAKEKLRQILFFCRVIVPESPKYKESLELLDYRVRDFFAYLQGNKATLAAYGKRYHAGKPISTAMAESAVNQVINTRMCKRQQMRWTPRGAHLLAQVRCAVINGDLAEKLKAFEEASVEEISPEVQFFIDQLNRAAA